MNLRRLHSWGVSVQEAREIQRKLAAVVSCHSAIVSEPRRIAGLDISPPDATGTVRAAAVILSYPTLEIEELSVAEGNPGFPYIPGYLSFRETPVLTDALERLKLSPDIIVTDGHGMAHPRRFGLACHIGLITDTPTIGCAKSVLIGKHGPLGEEAGSRADMLDREEVVGMALRTRTGVRPVYVSVGHKVDLQTAADWALACCRGKRLPETTRMAHKAAAGQIAPRESVPNGSEAEG